MSKLSMYNCSINLTQSNVSIFDLNQLRASASQSIATCLAQKNMWSDEQ
jgi:hypothetical protein